MRTIVALSFASILAAQSPNPPLEAAEKRVAQAPEDLRARRNLLQMLVNNYPGFQGEGNREKKRIQVLWLIEHHPEADLLSDSIAAIDPRKDAQGAVAALDQWNKQLAAHPDDWKIIANAASFFAITNRAAAHRFLDEAYRGHPDNAALARARGLVEVHAVAGSIGTEAFGRVTTSATLRNNPDAVTAMAEINSASSAPLLKAAGETLARGNWDLPYDYTFGEADKDSLSERWLRRALDLSPGDVEARSALGQALWGRARRAVDPAEKVRLLEQAATFVDPNTSVRMGQDRMQAEFDAGDDVSAGRDARALLEKLPSPDAYHSAHVVLGRLAFAQGDKVEAKKELFASVKLPSKFPNAQLQPILTLAQDFLDAGDRDTPAEFLDASRNVWRNDRGRIDFLIRVVKKSASPSLDSNQVPGREIIGRPAAAIQAQDLNRAGVSTDKLSGKVIAIAFRRTNCPACSEEVTQLDKLRADPALRDVALLVSNADEDESAARRYEIVTYPTLVVVDAGGVVRAYEAGVRTEVELRQIVDRGIFGNAGRVPLTGPTLIAPDPGARVRGKTVTLHWQQVENAASYLVEWDVKNAKGWASDQDQNLRVLASGEPSIELELPYDASSVRWRVKAVPQVGGAGKPSAWREFIPSR